MALRRDEEIPRTGVPMLENEAHAVPRSGECRHLLREETARISSRSIQLVEPVEQRLGGSGKDRPIVGTVDRGDSEREEPLDHPPRVLPLAVRLHLPAKRDTPQSRFAENGQSRVLAPEERGGTRSLDSDAPLLQK